MAELDALAMASFATAGYVLVEDAIAGSDLESLKRELEDVVATAAAEATADGGARSIEAVAGRRSFTGSRPTAA